MTLLVDARSTTPPTDTLESDVPTVETPAYQRSLSRWKRCRDLYAGSDAIRAGGEDYLPQFAGESDDLYEARKTIAGLFNGFARTVLATVGLLTQPEPVLSDDMPQPLVDMWENVDGAGTHGAVFTQKLSTAGMLDGFAGIITEFPRRDDPNVDRSRLSLAGRIAIETGGDLDASDQAALGLRPYFILVKVDDVLPIYETINGKRTLVMLIRREYATDRPGRFRLVTVTRYRVYELKAGRVFYERWSEPAPGGVPQRDEGPTEMRGLSGIPWSPFAPGDEIGEHEYKPTLLDMADLNITHHRIATGILSLEEQACVPTIVRVGCPPLRLEDDGTAVYPPIVTGPGNSIEVPAGTGVAQPVYYLSPPVDVLEPAMRSLDNCKSEMGAMGAQFLTPEPRAQETATAHTQDLRAEGATIGNVSGKLKDCLEAAFDWAGEYIGEEAGSVSVNEEFTGEGISTAYLGVLVSAFQQDVLTLAELRYVIKTGKLPEDFEPDDSAIVKELLTAAKAREDQARAMAIQKQAQTEGDRTASNGGSEEAAA